MILMKYIVTDNLPKIQYGANKGKVDWVASVGHTVNFVYEDVDGEIKILECSNDKNKILTVEYNGKISTVSLQRFRQGRISRLIEVYAPRKTYKYEVNTVIQDDKRDIVITDRFRKPTTHAKQKKYYKYTCNKCGWEDGEICENDLTKGNGCACCRGLTVVEGINDIPTTTPWMVKYFQGGYEEAKLYTRSSQKYIIPICPECNRVKDARVKIGDIYKYKSISCDCSGGKSYGEKFITELLTQLNIDYIHECSSKDLQWIKKKRYDFYIPSHNCIIEVHGKQHYGEKFLISKRSFVDEVKNDARKRELAKENGIDIYIELDCRKSDMDYIKSSIINSSLHDLFNLSRIDWLKCNEYALGNLVKTVCEYYNENDISLAELSGIFKISSTTAREYLKTGTKFGWCNYDPKITKSKASRKLHKNGIKVEVLKNDISLGVFGSLREVIRQSEKLFGETVSRYYISKLINTDKTYKNIYKFKSV